MSKGTRDFLPSEVAKRNYIFDTIKTVFRKYGFEQIETPAIEKLETLTGKYGEEGDKLLFKILNSGDYLKDVPKDELTAANSQSTTKYIAEKGLRYDLTVPLARYVVQHQDDLAFPFKRFHIGPVWRADRPQKGRYQEFYQCDSDVIGSNSLLNEVELTKIYSEVFEALKIQVLIKMNHRKIIQGIIEDSNLPVSLAEVMTAIDKFDKVPDGGEAQELGKIGLSEEQANGLLELMNCGRRDIDVLKSKIQSKDGLNGCAELSSIKVLVNNPKVVFDPTLARGLTYYTGIIWEVVADKTAYLNNDILTSSIGGGGRYDNLTEMFGGQNMSGVGISFGIERIYDVMEELNLFPETISQGVKVLFVPRDSSVEEFTFQQTQTLRDAGVGAEIFLGNVKKQKQFTYAEQKNIAYIVEVGGDEMQSKKFRLRNAKTRDTETDLSIEQIMEKAK